MKRAYILKSLTPKKMTNSEHHVTELLSSIDA